MYHVLLSWSQLKSSFASFFSDFGSTNQCRTFYNGNRATIFCSFSSERHSKLPVETLLPAFIVVDHHLSGKWIEKFQKKYKCEKMKEWQERLPDKIIHSRDCLRNCIFLDNGLDSQHWTVHLLRRRKVLKGLPLTSNAASGYFGPVVWHYIKESVPSFEKTILTHTIKASGNLIAGEGKFPPVTSGNRSQSLTAEIFAWIRR